jgi:hypothetical protein
MRYRNFTEETLRVNGKDIFAEPLRYSARKIVVGEDGGVHILAAVHHIQLPKFQSSVLLIVPSWVQSLFPTRLDLVSVYERTSPNIVNSFLAASFTE